MFSRLWSSIRRFWARLELSIQSPLLPGLPKPQILVVTPVPTTPKPLLRAGRETEVQLQKCVCHNAAPRCPTVPHRRGRARPPATAFTAAVSGGGRPRPWLECSVLGCVPGAVSPRDGGSPPPREADATSPTASRGPQGTGTGEPWVRRVGGSGSIQLPGARTHPPGVHTGGPRPGGCNRLCKSEPPSAGLRSQGPDFTPEMGSPHHRRGVPADLQT